MIHTRTHMYEDTKKALRKSKKQIKALSYEQIENKETVNKILENIYKENAGNEWFETIKFYDKITKWIKEEKCEKFWAYVKEVK